MTAVLTVELEPVKTEQGMWTGGDHMTGGEALQFGSALVAAAALLAGGAR